MRPRVEIPLAACLLALAAALPSTALGDPWPSADPNWRPPTNDNLTAPLANAPMLINDGSFENGPPPSSAWTEGATTVCEWIVDPTEVFGIGAYDGSYVFWAGGYCPLGVANVDSVSQSVSIPGDAGQLTFWIYGERGDPDDDGLDVAYLAINGTTAWQRPMSQANNTSGWIQQTINLAPYAGQTAELRLGGRGVGLTGNVLFDFIGIETIPTATRSGTWGALKTLYR